MHTYTDLNECMIEEEPCDANATCTNTNGSFTCECNDGYIGDGFTCNPGQYTHALVMYKTCVQDLGLDICMKLTATESCFGSKIYYISQFKENVRYTPYSIQVLCTCIKCWHA